MPYNNAPNFKASGTIAPCTFVTISSSFDEQVQQSTTGDLPIGIMWERQRDTPGLAGSDTTIAAISGDYGFRIYALGDDCLLELAGTVSAGQAVKPNASGKGISGAPGDNVGGYALQSGTSGTKIRVVVRPAKI